MFNPLASLATVSLKKTAFMGDKRPFRMYHLGINKLISLSYFTGTRTYMQYSHSKVNVDKSLSCSVSIAGLSSLSAQIKSLSIKRKECFFTIFHLHFDSVKAQSTPVYNIIPNILACHLSTRQSKEVRQGGRCLFPFHKHNHLIFINGAHIWSIVLCS